MTRFKLSPRSWIGISFVSFLLWGWCLPVEAGQGNYPIGEIGGRVALVENQPNVLLVKKVYPRCPGAIAGLKPGMLIVGVAGRPFTEGYLMPLRQLGSALDGARNKRGELTLNVRDGKQDKTITVRLSTLPGFSPTYPFNCKRTDMIYEHVCHVLAQRFKSEKKLPGGAVTNALAVMALLGHSSNEGRAAVKPYVMKVANSYASRKNDEKSVWLLSYTGVMLCEYYLMEPNPTVGKAITVIANRLRDNVPSRGRYGHHLILKNHDDIAYKGQGLNATTSAALWFFASASRCGLEPSEMQPAFGMALERIRKDTNANGGVGYAWKGDTQSSMRSGHTALAWNHLVLSPQLLGSVTSKDLRYRAKVATWPTRHVNRLLEAHAVSSLGIATSTAGLAAYDREAYIQVMQHWRWYFALSWQPNPAKYGEFEVAYVGGPNNTGGDFYLNGHRPLEKDFSSIMYATVGFILASSDERLSFYGGMPPIPGLTTTVLARSPQLTKAYAAMRQNRLGVAMRTALPLTEKLVDEQGVYHEEAKAKDAATGTTTTPAEDSDDKTKMATVALALIDYVDERMLQPEFDYLVSLYEGEDVALAAEGLKAFARHVKGIRKYEIDVDRMLDELKKKKYSKRIRIGKQFYKLKRSDDQARSREAYLKKWEKFKKTCPDEYYAQRAQQMIDELQQLIEFDKKWAGKDEANVKANTP